MSNIDDNVVAAFGLIIVASTVIFYACRPLWRIAKKTRSVTVKPIGDDKMKAQTKTLFHLTDFGALKSILKEGFWPQYCLEDFSWLDGVKPRLALPMVSFCEIPAMGLEAHAKRYGKFGIGVCRKQWQATGLNPVLYVSSDSRLRHFLGDLLVQAGKNPDPRIRTGAMVLLAHCKPLEGLTDNGEKVDFYSECEWRYTPWLEKGECKFNFFLEEQEFRNKSIVDAANAERRNDLLTFVPDDVQFLIVNSDQDAYDLRNFIDAEMGYYCTEAREFLKARIKLLNQIGEFP